LAQHRYRIFREGDLLYARKGIVGRVGPIVVHASMLIILAGSIWGALGGFLAQEMPASGDTFQVKNILDAGPWAKGRVPQDWAVKVNRFWIDYTPEGAIGKPGTGGQFFKLARLAIELPHLRRLQSRPLAVKGAGREASPKENQQGQKPPGSIHMV
jgi:hypothetical protein